MPGDSGPLGRSNPQVRRLRRLVGRRSERWAERTFVVEGRHGIETAFEAGAAVEALYVAADAGPEAAASTEAARARDVPVVELAPGVLESVADTVTPQPVLATVRMPATDFDELDTRGTRDPRGMSLAVVLAEVREPGNAGTIVRGAEAAGATAVVFCRGSADPFSPKVVRAAAGALFHVPVVQGGDAGEVVDVLAQRGVRCLGTVARGGDSYDRVDWTGPTALVLGNEAWGLPPGVAERLQGRVSVPMAGRSESLNVAMAATVLLFEARRQRAQAS